MLTLAGQRRVYAASVYIYIYILYVLYIIYYIYYISYIGDILCMCVFVRSCMLCAFVHAMCVCACMCASMCVYIGITAKPLDEKGRNLVCDLQVTGLILSTTYGCGNRCRFFIAISTGSCFVC